MKMLIHHVQKRPHLLASLASMIPRRRLKEKYVLASPGAMALKRQVHSAAD
jgi:hypothetical protein